MQIDQPALNLFARDFYMLIETEDERLAYRTLVRDVLVLLNADPKVAERDSLEILQFETELANVCNFNNLIIPTIFFLKQF